MESGNEYDPEQSQPVPVSLPWRKSVHPERRRAAHIVHLPQGRLRVPRGSEIPAKRSRRTGSEAHPNASAHHGPSTVAIMPDTKTCPHCGATFSRPAGMWDSAWKLRTFCSNSCAGKAGALGRKAELKDRCDCGNQATTTVWVVQGTGDGLLLPQRIPVCNECVDMWLEDGATQEPSTVRRGVRLWTDNQDAAIHEYFAPANINGFRRVK